ncbi:hypothetical protein [Xanthomonas phage BUDD]|nr:hypothetical protein [Xanthomonas phage BUDD]
MSRSAPISLEPWNAPTGYTLNPGDPVIYMTVSTGQGAINKGVFVGNRNGNAVIDCHYSINRFVDANDNEYDWRAERRAIPYTYFRNPNGYRYGTTEYREAEKLFEEQVRKPAEEARKKMQEGYAYKKFPAVRRTTLQNNRVYPANLALSEFNL